MLNRANSDVEGCFTGEYAHKRRIKIGLFCILLVSAWLFAADGYWHHRERLEYECRSGVGETLLNGMAGRVSAEVLEDDIIALSRVVCRFKIGAGYTRLDPRGLAYWELLLMAPVALRFNWNL